MMMMMIVETRCWCARRESCMQQTTVTPQTHGQWLNPGCGCSDYMFAGIFSSSFLNWGAALVVPYGGIIIDMPSIIYAYPYPYQ